MKRKLKILELFAGTECISNCFREHGHECFTVDWDEQFPSSLHIDIGELTSEMILEQFGKPDIVFLGLDCTSYSIAAISKHRRKNPVTGNLDPISDKAKRADEVHKHAIQVAKDLNPDIIIIENPRAGLRKMEWMQEFNRTTTTYCQYGFEYMKPTDFFSNIYLPLKPACKNGAPCHVRAPRGSRTGLQGVKGARDRSKYPKKLCEHIRDICEEYKKEKM